MSISAPLVDSGSEIFYKLEYLLQQQVGNNKIKVVECYDVSSVSQAQSFSSFCEKMVPINISHAFMLTSELQQPISDIVTNGIRVSSKNGLKICTSNLNIPPNSTIYEAVHVIVALGNTFNLMNPLSAIEHPSFDKKSPSQQDMRENYDSLCISSNNEYVVFKQQQVRTLHLIKFMIDDLNSNFSSGPKICDLCQDKLAETWCTNCFAKLCPLCDEKSHNGNKLLVSHKRIPLKDAKTKMESCPIHPGVVVEHFCFQCLQPVCVECKMSGSHSTGPAAKHALIPIKEAFEAAISHICSENKIVHKRKRGLETRRKDAMKRLNDVIQNQKTIEARIMKIAEDAILSLKKQAGERALVIRSTITEIDRKLEELDQNSEFLSTQKENSPPVSFIRSTCISDQVLEELKNLEDFPLELDVEGDLALTGGLFVCPRRESVVPSGKKANNQRFDERERLTDFVDSTVAENSLPSITENSETSSQVAPSPDSSSKKLSKPMIKVSKITTVAKRKMYRFQKDEVSLGFQPFKESQILGTDDANILYHCFPFKQTPQTHLLFSTERDGRSVRHMHELIDGIGITVVLIRNGEYIFGGFASSKWISNGVPNGQGTSAFLFSLTRDTIVPYRPQIEDPYVMLARKDSLAFGSSDLEIHNNFENCVSIIENCYGIGLDPDSKDAREFLAGESVFNPDIVEVWGFFTP